MAALDVKNGDGEVLRVVTQVIEKEGLDGLLSMVVLACQLREREAEQAGRHVERSLWRGRAHNCRAYKQMARRVEGRET